MRLRALLAAVTISPLLGGCLLGIALMPSSHVDPVAKVYLDGPPWAPERTRLLYKYKIVITGRSYGFNVHNPIGLLLGIWESSGVSEVVYVNRLDGTIDAGEREKFYVSLPPDAVGAISFGDKLVRINFSWMRRDEDGVSRVHPYRFNGEYQLEPAKEVTPEDRNSLDPGYEHKYCRELGVRYNKQSGDWEACR